jgi:hypothetical protein
MDSEAGKGLLNVLRCGREAVGAASEEDAPLVRRAYKQIAQDVRAARRRRPAVAAHVDLEKIEGTPRLWIEDGILFDKASRRFVDAAGRPPVV